MINRVNYFPVRARAQTFTWQREQSITAVHYSIFLSLSLSYISNPSRSRYISRSAWKNNDDDAPHSLTAYFRPAFYRIVQKKLAIRGQENSCGTRVSEKRDKGTRRNNIRPDGYSLRLYMHGIRGKTMYRYAYERGERKCFVIFSLSKIMGRRRFVRSVVARGESRGVFLFRNSLRSFFPWSLSRRFFRFFFAARASLWSCKVLVLQVLQL